jgi:hypothetical protein
VNGGTNPEQKQISQQLQALAFPIDTALACLQAAPSPSGQPERTRRRLARLLTVHRELDAKADQGDASYGIECATHGSAGKDAAGSG